MIFLATNPREPMFPPAFAGHAVEAGDLPVEAAIAAAMAGEAGAGDVFWSRCADRAAAAVVLEPEVSLSSAVQMGPTLMVAVGDALGSLGPPSLSVTYRWPATVLANGGRIGRISTFAPRGSELSDVPRQFVVGFDLAIRFPADIVDPGLEPDVTVLHEEGCGEIDSAALIGAVARHFLAWIDTWIETGFAPLRQAWMMRAQDMGRSVECAYPGGGRSGIMKGLDEEGGIILDSDGQTVSVPLASALERY